MKTFYACVMLCLASVSSVQSSVASTSGAAGDQTCLASEQSSAYSALSSLLNKDIFNGCASDTGYSLLFSTSLPTNDQYLLMCSSSNCNSLVSDIITLSPPDCILTVPTSSFAINVYKLVHDFAGLCDGILNPTTAPTTDPATVAPIKDPVTDEPVTDDPIPVNPPTEEPVDDEPVTDEPTGEPVTEEPATEEPTGEPATEQPDATSAPHLGCGGWSE